MKEKRNTARKIEFAGGRSAPTTGERAILGRRQTGLARGAS
jgi:hypothetical protein